jgi:hypothetical protein
MLHWSLPTCDTARLHWSPTTCNRAWLWESILLVTWLEFTGALPLVTGLGFGRAFLLVTWLGFTGALPLVTGLGFGRAFLLVTWLGFTSDKRIGRLFSPR